MEWIAASLAHVQFRRRLHNVVIVTRCNLGVAGVAADGSATAVPGPLGLRTIGRFGFVLTVDCVPRISAQVGVGDVGVGVSLI